MEPEAIFPEAILQQYSIQIPFHLWGIFHSSWKMVHIETELHISNDICRIEGPLKLIS